MRVLRAARRAPDRARTRDICLHGSHAARPSSSLGIEFWQTTGAGGQAEAAPPKAQTLAIPVSGEAAPNAIALVVEGVLGAICSRVTRKKTTLDRSPGPGYDAVLADVVRLVDAARRGAVRSVNAIITATYWAIGRRIVEQEQHGAVRAG